MGNGKREIKRDATKDYFRALGGVVDCVARAKCWRMVRSVVFDVNGTTLNENTLDKMRPFHSQVAQNDVSADDFNILMVAPRTGFKGKPRRRTNNLTGSRGGLGQE